MPKYELISIDSFEITNVEGDLEEALKAVGGEAGIKALVESFINGGDNA